MQIAPVDHVTYKITAIHFRLHAIFGLLQLFSTGEVIGLAEPLNYGLSMPPGQLRREWGMMRHFVAADSPAAAVRGRVDCGLIVDRWDAKCRPAASQVCSLHETT